MPIPLATSPALADAVSWRDLVTQSKFVIPLVDLLDGSIGLGYDIHDVRVVTLHYPSSIKPVVRYSFTLCGAILRHSSAGVRRPLNVASVRTPLTRRHAIMPTRHHGGGSSGRRTSTLSPAAKSCPHATMFAR